MQLPQDTIQAIQDDPDYFELQVWISYQQKYAKYLQSKADTLAKILHDVQQLRETHQQICDKIEEMSLAYAHKKSPPHHVGSLILRDNVGVATTPTSSQCPNTDNESTIQKKTDSSGGDAGVRETKQHPESTSRLKFVNPICVRAK